MHESPTRPWTVAQRAKEAALSRSAFFERFSGAVGVAPMEYLLAWRKALKACAAEQDGLCTLSVNKLRSRRIKSGADAGRDRLHPWRPGC